MASAVGRAKGYKGCAIPLARGMMMGRLDGRKGAV